MLKLKFKAKVLYSKIIVKGDLITPCAKNRPYMIKTDVNESIVPIAVEEESIKMLWREDSKGEEIYEGDTIRFTNFLFGSEVFDLSLEAKVGRNQDGFTLQITKSIFTELVNMDAYPNMEISVSMFTGLSEESIEKVN